LKLRLPISGRALPASLLRAKALMINDHTKGLSRFARCALLASPSAASRSYALITSDAAAAAAASTATRSACNSSVLQTVCTNSIAA
jgi:hypothetical protein